MASASTETLRSRETAFAVPPQASPQAPGEAEQPASSPGQAATADLGLEAFRSGRDDDRLVDLLAFAMAVEQGGAPPDRAEIARLRGLAATELSQEALRILHNQVQEIRREAVAEELAGLRRPLGFGTVVLANLLAIGIGAALLALVWPYLGHLWGGTGL